MTPLDRITERVNRNGDLNVPETPRPLLTLDEFFEGNSDDGSLCCNLRPTPEPSELRALLEGMASRTDVADVRVQITMFDDPEGWPFSDMVWVITRASPEEVASWFEEKVRPDQCGRGWTEGQRFEPCPIPPGMSPIWCWWD